MHNVAEFLEQDPHARATVIAQRLRPPLGFSGGLSILKEYLHGVRAQANAPRAYVLMEPGPGERFEVDWGHFDTLSYRGHARKLYAFCLVECHSRKLYLEFTHSESFETIHGWHRTRADGSIISRPPLPNMTASWCVSIRVFWPSLANIASSLGLVTGVRRGKKENRESHRSCQNQLLATAHVHRPSFQQI
jgi:hypothetical protein